MTELVSASAASARGSGRRTFLSLWLGQVISLVGTRATAFALGVWVFQQTGSATWFAAIALASNLPAILVSPLAGAWVDRTDRRRVMIGADTLAALGSLALLLLVATGHLALWHLYAVATLASLVGAFQFPAFSASVTLLLPKDQYARASGLVQLGRTGSDVVAPLLAGGLLGSFGLTGVIAVDLVTFLIAVTVLVLARVPSPPPPTERRSLWADAGSGWSWIRRRPGLLWLLGLIASFNLWLPLALVLTTPMVLGFTGVEELGLVLGLGAAGALAGSFTLTAWGGPEGKVRGLLAFTPVLALGLIVAGLKPSVPLTAAGLFLAMFAAPLIHGCSQAIWQRKVPPELQGRVFAVRRMIAQATAPVAFLAAGPLADGVFGPLLAAGGSAVGSLGGLWGVGPGRGIGLLFALLGGLLLLTSVFAFAHRPLMAVEQDVPDAG
ncbi:MAG: MFS transporter [Acidobacteriota bacterium]